MPGSASVIEINIEFIYRRVNHGSNKVGPVPSSPFPGLPGRQLLRSSAHEGVKILILHNVPLVGLTFTLPMIGILESGGVR